MNHTRLNPSKRRRKYTLLSPSERTNRADELTREVTAFRSFDELCAPGYTPTLMPFDKASRELASIFDLTMWARNDERRAYVGKRGAR